MATKTRRAACAAWLKVEDIDDIAALGGGRDAESWSRAGIERLLAHARATGLLPQAAAR